ncbi:MAG: CD225/dispanin family protein [Bacteroidales bacterium]|nr:CD225/dispanin family protein [Bacteroidales bacterium]
MNNIQDKCPRNHMALGLLATGIFLCPIGFLAIYYGAMVKPYWKYKDYENALKYSKKARMWGLITIPVGIVWLTIIAMAISMLI